MQDVYIARSGKHQEYGTAVRIYDPSQDAWWIAWSGPMPGRRILLTGRLQCTFSDLRGTSFR